eukprot:3369537-Amphidinium_carterae.2
MPARQHRSEDFKSRFEATPCTRESLGLLPGHTVCRVTMVRVALSADAMRSSHDVSKFVFLPCWLLRQSRPAGGRCTGHSYSGIVALASASEGAFCGSSCLPSIDTLFQDSVLTLSPQAELECHMPSECHCGEADLPCPCAIGLHGC